MTLQLIPLEACGIQLCKVFLNSLRLTEKTMFQDASGVELVLRRAAVSGRVSFNTPLEDHWADILDKDGDIIGHASLDADSFKALKGHWMRCRYVKYPNVASGMEAGTGETEGLDPKDDSQVPKGQTPKTSSSGADNGRS